MRIPAVLCPNFSKNYRVVMSYPYLCLCFLVLRLEQYANMFALLGQVGNLEDAKRAIEQMLIYGRFFYQPATSMKMLF